MISRGGGLQPRWRRDGRELFYLSADSEMMAVEVSLSSTFKAGVAKPLFRAVIAGGSTISNATRYDVSADGQKFLINSARESIGFSSAPITVVLNWQAALKK
jgi:hypothetical protein